jgi:spore coat protein H
MDVRWRKTPAALLVAWLSVCICSAAPKLKSSGDEVFADSSTVRHLKIEIPPEGIQTLRKYNFRNRTESPRTNVSATVREGNLVWTNVAVHLKGAFGSFRPVNDKPAFTLNFDKWTDGQTFHGLQKFSLNNSVQDPSYLNEKICREIYNAAGVPTPRADYATVELNGRYLGLYVLVEGWHKQFIKRHFKNPNGNLYDSMTARDVTSPATAAFGADPTNHAMLNAAKAAALETNHARRVERLRATVDVQRLLSLAALDCLMWNWDGYVFNHNNYRMYHDLDANRLVFMPHGVDQMFWKANGPIMTGRSGLVSKSLLETEEGRRLYLERFREIRETIFDVNAITNRLMQLAKRLRPAVAKNGVAELAQFESSVTLFRNRITARARNVDQQLESLKTFAPLKAGESTALTNWVARRQFGNLTLDRIDDSLHIKVNSETSFGAWTAVTWLEEGRYVIEGRVKTRGVHGALRNESGGAGYRVWSDRKETKGASWSWFPYNNSRDPQLGGLIPVVTNSVEQRLTGDSDWKTIRHEFELRQGLADLQIQCSLQAGAGEAWFDASSIRIRRLTMNVGKNAKGD